MTDERRAEPAGQVDIAVAVGIDDVVSACGSPRDRRGAIEDPDCGRRLVTRGANSERAACRSWWRNDDVWKGGAAGAGDAARRAQRATSRANARSATRYESGPKP